MTDEALRLIAKQDARTHNLAKRVRLTGMWVHRDKGYRVRAEHDNGFTILYVFPDGQMKELPHHKFNEYFEPE